MHSLTGGAAPNLASHDGGPDVSDSGYAAVGSLDTGSVARVAVSDSRIALASVSGGISLLAADDPDGSQFDVDGRPRGLAVDSLVYVALDDRIVAFDSEGSTRWRLDVAGVSTLTSLSEQSLLVAATDADEFVGIDAREGTERFRMDRTHADVAENVVLTGRDDRVLAGASWYLTAFDARGNRRHELDVDGAITGIGLLADVVVVSLRGGRLAGVDVASGTTLWERKQSVDWLAPSGGDALYGTVGGRIVRITSDGDVTGVADLSRSTSGRTAVTTDGSLACRIDGRTVELFRPDDSVADVAVALQSSSARTGEEVTVDVASRGNPARGEVRIESDEASFSPASRSVRLGSGDRTTLPFTLRNATEGSVAVTVEFASATDRDAEPTRVRDSLRVVPTAPELDVDAELSAIDDGSATLDVSVSTPDGRDLPQLSLSPGDVRVGGSPGQSSIRRTLSVPLDTDRVVVTPQTARRQPTQIDLSLPATPLSASVSARDGFVDVTLVNESPVTVDDAVRVAGSILPAPFSRSLSFAPGERVTLALPAVDSGPGEISVEAGTLSASTTLTLDRAALADGQPARRGTAPDGSDFAPRDETRQEVPLRSDHREHDAATAEGSRVTDRAAPSDVGTTSERENAAASAAEGDTDATRTERKSDATGSERETDTHTRPARDSDAVVDVPDIGDLEPSLPAVTDRESTSSRSESTPDDHPAVSPADDGEANAGDERPADVSPAPAAPAAPEPITLTRHLDSESVPEGHAVAERLTVSNSSSGRLSVTLESGETRETLRLAPGEEAGVSRYHAGWETTTLDVPAVTARTDDYETSVPAKSVAVESAPVVVRPTLFESGSSTDVRLEVENGLDRRCSIAEVGARGFTRGVPFDGFDVDPGSTSASERAYQGTPVENPALTYVRITQRRKPIQTIAPVRDRASAPVEIAVQSVDDLGGRDTNVLLAVTNGGDVPLDVQIEATGEAPDDYLYSMSELDGLPPGETATHRVECTVDDDRLELPIELAATPSDAASADDPWAETVLISGDRAATAAAWTVDRGDATDEDAFDAPTTLSTPFDRRSEQ
ncbi:hypothetical protein DVK02_10710 [Halobellus sp. Atlit-31R]|nr:hypothetical protein DVK02_10710 [Halobellus sp. Atlit-31R]